MKLTEEQKALLTLLRSADTRGIALPALLISASEAGFDLTFDFVRATVRQLSARGLAEFREGRWYIKTAGKKQLEQEPTE